jgi:hypothetical protein
LRLPHRESRLKPRAPVPLTPARRRSSDPPSPTRGEGKKSATSQTPSPRVGEGFPPRSCSCEALRKSHVGKGEGRVRIATPSAFTGCPLWRA